MEPDFRHEHRRVVAALVRKFGARHLDAILDSTQDAMVAALQTWPNHGAPHHPAAWLVKAGERRMIERFRREKRLVPDLPEDQESHPEAASELDLYRMACCPKLSPRERVCLVLRTCGGLTAGEIARLLHETEEAVQRRITRSKDKLDPSDLAPGDDWESLLLVFYLLFTEGYEVSGGRESLRADLAFSAIRLAEEFAATLRQPLPELEALLALMRFLLSRLPARLDGRGEAVLLSDQDPGRFDPTSIAKGFWHLARAQAGGRLSRYHVEAGLAAAVVRGAGSQEILEWHDMLVRLFPSPMARLSHALAVGAHLGWEAGLEALLALGGDPVLARSPYFLGALGYAHAQTGARTEAADWYRRAASAAISPGAAATFERHLRELDIAPPGANAGT